MSDHPMAVDPQRPPSLRGGRGRRLDGSNDDANVDYWRQRAGWADDDASMMDYNQGVYNTYYNGDDDGLDWSMIGGGGDGGGDGEGGSVGTAGARHAVDHMGWILGLASTVIFLVLLAKCCTSTPSSKSGRRGKTSSVKSRDSSRSVRDKHSERRSRSRSRAAGSSGGDDKSRRSRSKSRTRSKSRSAAKAAKGEENGYKLMDDDEGSRRSNHSRRSGRSRSRSKAGRSRSRSKSKSRSKSQSRGGEDKRDKDKRDKKERKSKKDKSKEQKMLV